VAPVQVIHRGKFKSLSPKRKTWLKRRRTIELPIGQTIADHRMDRCWLKGPEGDALHAMLSAAGFDIRWLLQAIARLDLDGLLLALTVLAPYAANTAKLPRELTAGRVPAEHRDRRCSGDHVTAVGASSINFAESIPEPTCSLPFLKIVMHSRIWRQYATHPALRPGLPLDRWLFNDAAHI
tara:strand:- start:29494 stop:30036 length:543 start_codon:yes stop_codon:yes gene_type:complete